MQSHQCHSKGTSDFVFLGSSSVLATTGHSSESRNVVLWDTLMPQRKAVIHCKYFFIYLYLFAEFNSLNFSFLFSFCVSRKRRYQLVVRSATPASNICWSKRGSLPLGFKTTNIASQIHGTRVFSCRKMHGSRSERRIFRYRICRW